MGGTQKRARGDEDNNLFTRRAARVVLTGRIRGDGVRPANSTHTGAAKRLPMLTGSRCTLAPMHQSPHPHSLVVDWLPHLHAAGALAGRHGGGSLERRLQGSGGLHGLPLGASRHHSGADGILGDQGGHLAVVVRFEEVPGEV